MLFIALATAALAAPPAVPDAVPDAPDAAAAKDMAAKMVPGFSPMSLMMSKDFVKVASFKLDGKVINVKCKGPAPGFKCQLNNNGKKVADTGLKMGKKPTLQVSNVTEAGKELGIEDKIKSVGLPAGIFPL